MPHTRVYANAAASMASANKHEAVKNLINSIKGTVNDNEWDYILFAAVIAYVKRKNIALDEWTMWFAEGLIEVMISPHAKVKAYLKLGNVSGACRIATDHDGFGDLLIVKEYAESVGDKSTVKKCEQILRRARVSAQ